MTSIGCCPTSASTFLATSKVQAAATSSSCLKRAPVWAFPVPTRLNLRLATFNVGGVDALRKGPDRITTVRDALTRDLQRMSGDCDPDVIALQEVVRVTDAHTTLDIVCLPEGYDYKFVEAFNSHDYQAPGRKQKYRDAAWKPEVRLQQGMAFAVKRQ